MELKIKSFEVLLSEIGVIAVAVRQGDLKVQSCQILYDGPYCTRYLPLL
jgi:hypothetical protein